MAVRLKGFDRELKLFLRDLEPAAISRELATFARAERDAAIRRGEASPTYRQIVDGVAGAPEESVRPDGKIVYEFDIWADVIEAVLALARSRSPVGTAAKTLRYRDSWFVMVNGTRWDGGVIPPLAEVVITNDKPYARKIEVGAMVMSVPAGIVEDLDQFVRRRFGNFIRSTVRFIELEGGYVLRGHGRHRAAAPNARSKAFRAGRRTLAGRKDTAAGQPLTYPALVLATR